MPLICDVNIKLIYKRNYNIFGKCLYTRIS